MTNLWQGRSTLQGFWSYVLSLVNSAYGLNAFNYSSTGQGGFPTTFNANNLATIKNLYHNRGAVNSGILASYLHSNLTNPHADWMKIAVPENYHLKDKMISDEKLMELKSLQLLSQECHNTWQSSNFHSAMYGFYKNIVDIGTACLFRSTYKVGRRDWEPNFKNISMFNVFFMEDAFGRPAHTFVIYRWTAYQIVSYFYPNLSDMQLRAKLPHNLIESYLKRDLTLWNVVHSVYTPNMDDTGVRSYYFIWDDVRNHSDPQVTGMDFLKTEILKFNPYSISRIRKHSESFYGTGFSMEAFPLLANLQRMQKAIWLANDKNVKPPMNTPTEKVNRLYSTDPGASNAMDWIGGSVQGLTPSMPPIDVQKMELSKQSLLQDIDQTYLIDKILMENVKYNRSATEVQKRTGEEIKILSPFIGSLETEFLRPLVGFTLDMFTKRGSQTATAQALNYLHGNSYRLQYISPIAQMQVQKQIMNMLEFYGYSNALSQKDKRIDNRIDWLSYLEKLAILSNAPFDAFKSLSEFRQAQQQQQQAMQEMQAQQNMQNIGNVGGAYKNFMQGEQIRRAA